VKTLTVKLLICGLCKADTTVKPEDRFRAADSERGRRSVVEHMLDRHSAAMVNSLLNSWENR
jgi:hypothetical protein